MRVCTEAQVVQAAFVGLESAVVNCSGKYSIVVFYKRLEFICPVCFFFVPPYFLFAYSALLKIFWKVEDGGNCHRLLNHRSFQNQGALKRLAYSEGPFV